MAKKRNYALTPPANLTELNKESMLAYVEGLGKDEDLLWFIELLDSNKEIKHFNFDTKDGKHKKGDEINGYNLTVIRKAFAKRYFPNLLENKQKKAPEPFETRLEEIRKRLGKK